MSRRVGFCLLALALLAAGCSKDAEQKAAKTPATPVTITVGGSDTNTPFLEAMIREYRRAHPEVTLDFMPSSHTVGGINAAVAGDVDLGAVSRVLDPAEKALGLTYSEPARDGLVFVTNPNVTVKNLTSAQLRDVYGGKITRWSQLDAALPDRDIVVINRPSHSSPFIVLAGTLFTGNFVYGKNLVLVERARDVNESLIKTPDTLGYTSQGAILTGKMAVNVLSVDGAAPTPENVRSGAFPYWRPMAVVYQPGRKKAVDDFVAFMGGPEGRRIALENGYVPPAP